MQKTLDVGANDYSKTFLFLISFVSHTSIITSDKSSLSSDKPSNFYRTFRYNFLLRNAWDRSKFLRLVNFLFLKINLLSCYAFFKGWLIPSTPHKLHYFQKHYPLKILVKDLTRCDGLFPIRHRTFSPHVRLLKFIQRNSEFNYKRSATVPPSLVRALPSLTAFFNALLV